MLRRPYVYYSNNFVNPGFSSLEAIPNLEFLFRGDRGVYTDLAKTVPSIPGGDADFNTPYQAAVWADQSPNGRDAVYRSAGGGVPPLYRLDSIGNPCIGFNINFTWFAVYDTPPLNIGDYPVTLFFLVTRDANGPMLSGTTPLNAQSNHVVNNQVNPRVYTAFYEGGNTYAAGTDSVLLMYRKTLVIPYDGINPALIREEHWAEGGVPYVRYSNKVNIGNPAMSVGGWVGTYVGILQTGKVGLVGGVSDLLSLDDMNRVRELMSNDFTFTSSQLLPEPTFAHPDEVIFLGDSLTYGSGGDPFQGCTPYYVMAAVEAAKGYPLRWYHQGIFGDSAGNMINRYISYVRPLRQPGTTQILCLHGGTNDIHGGVSAGTTYSYIDAIRSLAQADGFLIVVYTISKGDGLYCNPAVVDAFNGLIMANAADFDGVARLDLDPNIGPVQVVTPNTYFADGIHKTTVGYQVESSIVAPLVIGLL